MSPQALVDGRLVSTGAWPGLAPSGLQFAVRCASGVEIRNADSLQVITHQLRAGACHRKVMTELSTKVASDPEFSGLWGSAEVRQ